MRRRRGGGKEKRGVRVKRAELGLYTNEMSVKGRERRN